MLAELLQGLEAKFGGNSSVACKDLPKPLHNCVHSGAPTPSKQIPLCGDGNRQFYALHNGTQKEAEPLPVIVVVGINYSQGSKKLPTSPPKWPGVEETLPGCKSNTDNILKNSNDKKNRDLWIASGFRSKQVHAPKNYHLVLSNFCPWISLLKWSDPQLNQHQKASLMLNLNPTNNIGKNINFGIWEHLVDLKANLNSSIHCWVGHTLGSPVPILFSQFITTNKIGNWVIGPNLTSSSCANWNPNAYI